MIDLTPLYNRKITGVEIYGIEFYKALLKTKHEIIPMFRKANTIDSNPLSIIFPCENRFLVENLFLPISMKKNKADAVFFPIFPPPLLSYSNNIQIIPTIHDLAFKKYANTLSYKARLYLTPKYNQALKNASKIITISNTIKKELSNETNIEIINWGNNISENYQKNQLSYNETVLKKFRLQPGRYLISVSTVEPRKNLPYLLQIWSQIKDEFTDYKLVLTGRYGWGTDKLLDFYLNKCKDSIVFTDYVTQQELENLYHFSIAFVLLSKYEGFGRTPLEAFACGTNIIVSDIPIFREILSPITNNFIPLDNINVGVSILRKAILNNTATLYKREPLSNYFRVLEKNITNNIDKILE